MFEDVHMQLTLFALHIMGICFSY